MIKFVGFEIVTYVRTLSETIAKEMQGSERGCNLLDVYGFSCNVCNFLFYLNFILCV